jgi:hypothetical protein
VGVEGQDGRCGRRLGGELSEESRGRCQERLRGTRVQGV